MIYAPIMIPTLCRYEHFIRCIESLKQNSWASKTEVYIALDYPAKKSHWDGYMKICSYLEGDFHEFAGFYVFKRDKNYGSAENNRKMQEWLLEKYNCFIRTDDDIEFSPNFLEYMDKCLEKYEKDSDVVAVSGYSYPIDWKTSAGSTVLKINCTCPMWGTGFWKDKMYLIKNNIEGDYFRKNAKSIINDRKYEKLPDARLVDFASSLSLDESNLLHSMSDIAIGTYIAIEGKYIISPVISKSRNYGFDGTGVYCPVIGFNKSHIPTAHNYDYTKQPIDMEYHFELIQDQFNDDIENIKRFNCFDTRTRRETKHAKRKIKLYKITEGGGDVLSNSAHEKINKNGFYEVEVSVCCLTYNHALYIKDALESFVNQKTTFRYEVIVHDDASTDNTPDIIKEYAKKYPDIIIPIIQKENQYSKGINIIGKYIYPKIRGKYVATCEGDDYWTNVYKLQFQYEALEQNKDCIMCSHYTTEWDMNSKNMKGLIPGKSFKLSEGIVPRDKQIRVSLYSLFHLSSWFIRKDIYAQYLLDMPAFAKDYGTGDTPLLLYIYSKGNIYFLDKKMSLYRKGVEGSYTCRIERNVKKRKLILEKQKKGLILYKSYLGKQYPRIIDEYIRTQNIWMYFNNGNYKKACSIKNILFMSRRNIKGAFKLLLYGLYLQNVSIYNKIYIKTKKSICKEKK